MSGRPVHRTLLLAAIVLPVASLSVLMAGGSRALALALVAAGVLSLSVYDVLRAKAGLSFPIADTTPVPVRARRQYARQLLTRSAAMVVPLTVAGMVLWDAPWYAALATALILTLGQAAFWWLVRTRRTASAT